MTSPTQKYFLHIGCGTKRKASTTRGFNSDDWTEIRLDIDPELAPDIIGTMTDMNGVATGSVDAIFSSHNVEHLYPHEVPVALAEFRRVLKKDGFVVITCPDLKSVSKLISEDKLTQAAYKSGLGPIAPIDILYGHRPSIASGNLFMAHRCGFTEKVMIGTLRAAGFASIATFCRGFAPYFDIWAVASPLKQSEDEIESLVFAHFPI